MVYTKKFSKRCCESPKFDIDYSFVSNVIGVEPAIENGRVINKTVIQEVDSRDKFKDIKVSDYFLENLIATGAVSQLNNVNISGSVLTDIDKIEDHLSQLDSLEIDDEISAE